MAFPSPPPSRFRQEDHDGGGGENLDAQLEPIAQLLILIIILIGVATLAFLIINKVARRR